MSNRPAPIPAALPCDAAPLPTLAAHACASAPAPTPATPACASPPPLAPAGSSEAGPSLTRAALALRLNQTLGLNLREARDLVDAFFAEISAELAERHSVLLSGFGAFQVRAKTARPGRNPRTGETFPVAARHVVTFHPSHKMRALCVACHGAAASFTNLAAREGKDA